MVDLANGQKQFESFLLGLQSLQEHASEPSNLKGFEILLIFYGTKQYLSYLWTGEGTKYHEEKLWPGKHEYFYPSMRGCCFHSINAGIKSILKKKDTGNPICVAYKRWDKIR